MEVRLAQHAGTCFGVHAALITANKALEGSKSVSSLGPLIHNPQVVRELGDRGLAVVDTPEDITTESVIIRSHGVPPEVRRALDSSGADIVDATCPFVRRAQEAAARLGKNYGFVVIVGEADHPEVDALCKFAQEAGALTLCALSPEDLPADLPERVGVVAQTTQRASVLQTVLTALASRGVQVEVANTICNATTRRQDAATELAGQVDAMVVLGGYNSSNTKRLAEICAGICPKVFHVESLMDFTDEDIASLRECRVVGLTAGASTPESQIRTTIAGLEYL